jgi:hypothetical protein
VSALRTILAEEGLVKHAGSSLAAQINTLTRDYCQGLISGAVPRGTKMGTLRVHDGPKFEVSIILRPDGKFYDVPVMFYFVPFYSRSFCQVVALKVKDQNVKIESSFGFNDSSEKAGRAVADVRENLRGRI